MAAESAMSSAKRVSDGKRKTNSLDQPKVMSEDWQTLFIERVIKTIHRIKLLTDSATMLYGDR
jgi:hypothetical protein